MVPFFLLKDTLRKVSIFAGNFRAYQWFIIIGGLISSQPCLLNENVAEHKNGKFIFLNNGCAFSFKFEDSSKSSCKCMYYEEVLPEFRIFFYQSKFIFHFIFLPLNFLKLHISQDKPGSKVSYQPRLEGGEGAPRGTSRRDLAISRSTLVG